MLNSQGQDKSYFRTLSPCGSRAGIPNKSTTCAPTRERSSRLSDHCNACTLRFLRLSARLGGQTSQIKRAGKTLLAHFGIDISPKCIPDAQNVPLGEASLSPISSRGHLWAPFGSLGWRLVRLWLAFRPPWVAFGATWAGSGDQVEAKTEPKVTTKVMQIFVKVLIPPWMTFGSYFRFFSVPN